VFKSVFAVVLGFFLLGEIDGLCPCLDTLTPHPRATGGVPFSLVNVTGIAMNTVRVGV